MPVVTSDQEPASPTGLSLTNSKIYFRVKKEERNKGKLLNKQFQTLKKIKSSFFVKYFMTKLVPLRLQVIFVMRIWVDFNRNIFYNFQSIPNKSHPFFGVIAQ